MKVIAFAQLRNELEVGNLPNWFRSLEYMDHIYIYDQNSTDGSKEYYKKFDNVSLIESPINNFSEEIKCKSELLEKLLAEHPDVDWIFWMDGDTILDKRLLDDDGAAMYQMLESAQAQGVDLIYMMHYNLWRSDVYYRVDDQYHALGNGVPAFWRNNGNLRFPKVSGLHRPQCPDGLTKAIKTDYALIHQGFAKDDQIMRKYDVYKARGQSGWALDRLLNEEGLTVEHIPFHVLPDWMEIDKSHPANKRRIREIYNDKN